MHAATVCAAGHDVPHAGATSSPARSLGPALQSIQGMSLCWVPRAPNRPWSASHCTIMQVGSRKHLMRQLGSRAGM